MKLKNSRYWVQHTKLEIVRDSILILLFAFAVRYSLQDFIEPYAPFHFFMVACLVTAARYGYIASLCSLVISSFLGIYFFVKPYNTIEMPEVTDLIQIANYMIVTFAGILIIEKLQRTIYAQKLLIGVMEDHHRTTLVTKNDLAYEVKTLKLELNKLHKSC